MAWQTPVGEAMSRRGKGKGTEAGSEAGSSRPVPWSTAARMLAGGGWFFLSTVRPDGAPHTVPVFAALSDPALGAKEGPVLDERFASTTLYVASKDTARKSRNLAADGRCTLATDARDLHLIVEGGALRVRDEEGLGHASATFMAVYGWPTVVAGETLDAEYGAPTSGGPPYDVYAVTPTKAFGFPADGESFTPTRWTFT